MGGANLKKNNTIFTKSNEFDDDVFAKLGLRVEICKNAKFKLGRLGFRNPKLGFRA